MLHRRFLLHLVFTKVFIFTLPLLVDCLISELSKCHSCKSHCEHVDSCECTSSDGTICQGEYCYVRMDRLSDDGSGEITKGCTNLAHDTMVGKCQYAGVNTSIECYCRGDLCNNADKLDQYRIDPLPLVECCECEGINEANETQCLADTCLRNCTGNYCFNNILVDSQGCGWGYSTPWQFLRNSHTPRKTNVNNSHFLARDDADMTCTEAFADIRTMLRGCTCASDFCNTIEKANDHVKNETEKRPYVQDNCYAVHAVSNKPTTLDDFRKSTTCSGHFCFITVATTTISFDDWSPDPANLTVNGTGRTVTGGRRRLLNLTRHTVADEESWPKVKTRYELTAGCLLVDDTSMVETGCTTEWSTTMGEPTRKHCVCSGHICNYLNLITGENRQKFLSFDWRTSKDYKTITASASRIGFHYIAFHIAMLVTANILIRTRLAV